MKINLCVNGTFRYPHYARHYDQAGVLGTFFYAHRRSTTPAHLGLRAGTARNVWHKEYALQAAWRLLPGAAAAAAEIPICDIWQRDVIRHWRDCDAVEAVVGAVADRVIALAKRRGARVLGHPVCAHPDTVAALVGRAHADLGLDPASARPSAMRRRRAELDLCDHLLVDSTFAARSYERAGIAPHRITALSPGVDLARFFPRGGPERKREPFRVVCVGTITPRKGQHVLLEAWRRLGLPDAELVLIGPPGRHAAAVLRGFEGSFVHHRRVPHAALRDMLVRASVFVMPSIEDGFAQAPLEAMACGIPVIVTGHVGMAELVTEGRDGFVVPALDPDAIADRLERLHRDRDLAAAMGEAAVATARRCGDWSAYAARVIALHRSLAAGTKAAAA